MAVRSVEFPAVPFFKFNTSFLSDSLVGQGNLDVTTIQMGGVVEARTVQMNVDFLGFF